uniref:Glycosyltransferase 2-like domain-containing protein n=1 Tax=viral metagenome TaxID=1070528 RepID=A0A6C0KVS4_9ZZZZ
MEIYEENNELIFIQIASYRDPELLPTIKSAFENAMYPENLIFCICWQRDDTETLMEFENHPQVKLITVPYKDSKGACWARNLIQKKYNGEKYTLQLDSHHRFIKDWDQKIVKMYNDLKDNGYKKPLITTYLPAYEPDNYPERRTTTPTKIYYKETTSDGSILFGSSYIDNHESLTAPIKCYFYSAHFCFTSGDFCINVKHDPSYYFTGEEMNITVRAYTHGYDLFHPHILIAWHEYTRKYRTKHWDDDSNWWKLDKVSKMRNRAFFSMELPGDNVVVNKEEYFGEYWIGKERSIENYEKESGINFKLKDVEKIENLENLENSKNENLTRTFYRYEFFVPEYKNLKFLYLGFQDKSEKELHRIDITDFTKEKVVAKFESSVEPYKYIWWPYYNESGWGEKVDIIL